KLTYEVYSLLMHLARQHPVPIRPPGPPLPLPTSAIHAISVLSQLLDSRPCTGTTYASFSPLPQAQPVLSSHHRGTHSYLSSVAEHPLAGHACNKRLRGARRLEDRLQTRHGQCSG